MIIRKNRIMDFSFADMSIILYYFEPVLKCLMAVLISFIFSFFVAGVKGITVAEDGAHECREMDSDQWCRDRRTRIPG